MLARALLAALTLCSAALGQQTGSDPQAAPATAAPADATSSAAISSTATSGPQSPQWRSLSVEEKLQYDAGHLKR
jgi:hypothetical protein